MSNPALTNMVGDSHYKPLVVILNGPPGCGKDTIAEEWLLKSHIASYSRYTKSFKEPMYKVASAALGLKLEDFLEFYKDRNWKEKPRPEWGGRSVRDLMISTSEDYLKPMFGKNYMGTQAVNSIKSEGRNHNDVILFTDGGFEAEVRELEKSFNVVVVQVHRNGCDFSGDSRNYIEGEQLETCTLSNNRTISEARYYLDWIIAENRDKVYGRS